jgi:hypothetical protein
MLLRMRREMGADEPTQIVPEIDTLILIDRQTDMVTPMCTQLTYEGSGSLPPVSAPPCRLGSD